MTEGNGQTIVVSGGSRGLGQALVTALLASEDRVATFSRSETGTVLVVAGCQAHFRPDHRGRWRAKLLTIVVDTIMGAQ